MGSWLGGAYPSTEGDLEAFLYTNSARLTIVKCDGYLKPMIG